MSSIFLSYSHSDGAFASTLANDLLDSGHDVWIDLFNLPGGTMWEQDIFAAIDAANILLLIWSGNMEGSVFAPREYQQAKDKAKTIIPVVIGGDPERMWEGLSERQWIDFRDSKQYATSLSRLLADLPRPVPSEQPPQIERLIQRGDTQFGSAARQFRSKLEYGPTEDDAVGLLLKRDPLGLQSFLVGRRGAVIQSGQRVDVFFNVSRLVEQDSFRDYLSYVKALGIDPWTVLVRGPILDTSNGLSFWLPDDHKVYSAAVRMAWSGVAKVAQEATPLHLFVNGPVALAAAFTAAENIRRPLTIYQLNMKGSGAGRYFPAYGHNVRL